MHDFLVSTLALAWLAILAGSWFGWQLLRQSGRILLRLDELERRLAELEFGGGDEPEGLPVGSEAPAFELPNLAGERRSLAGFRGHRALLIFFNPACGFCRDLAPKLAAMQRAEGRGARDEGDPSLVTSAASGEEPANGHPLVLIITTGGTEENRTLFREHRLDCPVLLQKSTEVATAYEAHGTPSGYLVSAEGKIASELAMGAEALLELAAGRSEVRGARFEGAKSESKPNLDAPTAGNGDGRASRFGERSLARSRIKRDGLKAGTPAPGFSLPRLDGRGDLALEDLRGRRVLLVFSSLHCGPCLALAPKLEKFYRSQRPLTLSLSPGGGEGVRRTDEGEAAGVVVVMISQGEPAENRAKVREYGLTFPVVLQQHWEVARLYAMFATPVAYLIDEEGIIAHDVAVGVEAIQTLLTQAGQPAPAEALALG